jgi:hypothetical protein
LCKQNMAVELIVHFMRSADNEHHDDCIRISKHSGNFLVHSILLLNEGDNARLRTSAIMSHHAVTRFLQDVFALVALDCIPFESVQLSSPLGPAVVLDVSNGSFEKARDTLVRLVDTSLSHWPDLAHEPSAAGKKRRRLS